MSKKKGIIFGAIGVACVAIIIGFCCVFFGNKAVKGVPQTLYVDNIEGNYFLITDFSGEYTYRFKLEHLIDEEYFMVSEVDSKSNMLNLSEQNLGIIAGDNYRFSVCFVLENEKGAYSQTMEWQPNLTLSEIDYDFVEFQEDSALLTWKQVYLADGYSVRLVDQNGTAKEFKTQTNQISLDNVQVGRYKIFIMATSKNSYIFPSLLGEGKEILIKRQNQILSAERKLNNALSLSCSQQIDKVEIFVDGKLKATLDIENVEKDGTLFLYHFSKVGFILDDVDFETSIVQLKTLESEFVFESDLIQLK